LLRVPVATFDFDFSMGTLILFRRSDVLSNELLLAFDNAFWVKTTCLEVWTIVHGLQWFVNESLTISELLSFLNI
jgi:hypothetical protein